CSRQDERCKEERGGENPAVEERRWRARSRPDARARQGARTHKLAGSYPKDDDFVFTTLTGQPIYYRNASARGLQKAADRAGLNGEGLPKLSFHDLRHTAITHLIRAGTDVAQGQRFAGHRKPSNTRDIHS